MKRRKLDFIFSIGGGLTAVLLLVLGLVLTSQANFAKDYVRDQLLLQKITFTPAAGLSAEEKSATCIVTNAGKALTTGKQAECYANNYIGLHVKDINGGKTYSESSGEARDLQAKADEATKSDPTSPTTLALVGEAKASAGKVDALFKGETLRGLLLTTYGFSIFGERAGQAALVLYLVAAILAIASIAGLIHAFGTSTEELVLPEVPHQTVLVNA